MVLLNSYMKKYVHPIYADERIKKQEMYYSTLLYVTIICIVLHISGEAGRIY